MMSEINNVKCAKKILNDMDEIDFPRTRQRKYSPEWISVKEALPLDEQFVRVKMTILYRTEKEAMYVKKYFVCEGENITRWVTHWKPSDDVLHGT